MPDPNRAVLRCGAGACVVTAVVAVAGSYTLSHPPAFEPVGSNLTYEALYLLQSVSQLITVAAIRHAHRRSTKGWGRLGEVAAWPAVAGLGLVSVKQTLVVLSKLTSLDVPSWLAQALMAPGTILTLIGLPLTGIAMIRARVLPSWLSWTVALQVPISVFGFNLLLPEILTSIAGSSFSMAIAVGLWRAASRPRKMLAEHHQSSGNGDPLAAAR